MSYLPHPSGVLTSRKCVRSPRKSRHLIRPLEQLDDRVMPIVGQYAALDAAGTVIPGEFLAAPSALPHQGYDGVVKLQRDAGIGTGSLFSLSSGQSWGHHILSAAHILDAVGRKATFEMFRRGAPAVPGGPPSVVPIPIVIDILPGADYQVPHPTTDLAVARLADPVGVTNPSRLLVAPANAEQYSLYGSDDENGKQVTVVGYGRSGDGERGAFVVYGVPAGKKRQGVNEISKVFPQALQFDFDSGDPVHNTLAVQRGSTAHIYAAVSCGTWRPARSAAGGSG